MHAATARHAARGEFVKMLFVFERSLAYAWAAPNSLLGLGLGALVLALGGRAERMGGVVEFCGGGCARGIERLPLRYRFDAITFGHVILARDDAALATLRRHERAHVRQYERWGVFFLPAYAASSGWQWLRGGRAHADNHFERRARAEAH